MVFTERPSPCRVQLGERGMMEAEMEHGKTGPTPYEKRYGALEYVGKVYPELKKDLEGVRNALLMRPRATISRCLGLFRRARMSRSRLTAETRGRNCELAFERTVESGFGLIAHFGCDLSHRITG